MAKNVTLNGVTYNGVTNVVLPQAGGGEAVFSDSGGTATSKVLLETKTAENGDAAVVFDWDASYANYAYFIVGIENLEQSVSAYCRLGVNTTGTSGVGFYINGSTKFVTKADAEYFVPLVTINGSVYNANNSGGNTNIIGTAMDMTNGYIRIGPVSATLVSGTFKLYGVR